MSRPNSVLGLSREVARTYWQRLGRGWKVLLFTVLLVGAAGAAVGSGMFSCPSQASSGCPYANAN